MTPDTPATIPTALANCGPHGTVDELEWEYVDQCGCGGHVTRVHVE